MGSQRSQKAYGNGWHDGRPTERQAARMFVRVCKLYERNGVRVRFARLRGKHGEVDKWEKIILIDLRGKAVRAAVHEAIHLLHPYWPEKMVLKAEGSVIRIMGQRRTKRLLAAIGNHRNNGHIRTK